MTSREALCYPAERQGGSNCGPAGGCSCVTFTGVLLKTAQRNAGVQTLVLRLILSQTCLTPPMIQIKISTEWNMKAHKF